MSLVEAIFLLTYSIQGIYMCRGKGKVGWDNKEGIMVVIYGLSLSTKKLWVIFGFGGFTLILDLFHAFLCFYNMDGFILWRVGLSPETPINTPSYPYVITLCQTRTSLPFMGSVY